MSNQNARQLHEARENSREQVTIGLGFTSDWLRKRRDFLSQSLCKTKVNANYFDAQVKPALNVQLATEVTYQVFFCKQRVACDGWNLHQELEGVDDSTIKQKCIAVVRLTR